MAFDRGNSRCRCTLHPVNQSRFPRANRKGFQMNNVEQFEQKAKEQSDAAIASAHPVAASVQAITAAHADYTKKALQDGSEFITKLASLKALPMSWRFRASMQRQLTRRSLQMRKKSPSSMRIWPSRPTSRLRAWSHR